MIQKFVKKFMAAESGVKAALAQAHPESYENLVGAVVKVLAEDEYDSPDPARITRIDHGDYQGTLLFIIGAGGYQPSTYWAMAVSYGSCSGCDTLQAIRGYEDEVTPEQVNEYWTLMLHLVQGMKRIAGWGEDVEEETPEAVEAA
jgi:hypothetical protein